MSYCRWSSDNFRCQLYCYESAEGWVTHVAARKPKNVPEELPFPHSSDNKEDIEKWLESHNKVLEYLGTAEYDDVTLPYAGESFSDPTLETFKERLLWLRELGYNFPDYVLEDVDAEIADERNKNVANREAS